MRFALLRAVIEAGWGQRRWAGLEIFRCNLRTTQWGRMIVPAAAARPAQRWVVFALPAQEAFRISAEQRSEKVLSDR